MRNFAVDRSFLEVAAYLLLGGSWLLSSEHFLASSLSFKLLILGDHC